MTELLSVAALSSFIGSVVALCAARIIERRRHPVRTVSLNTQNIVLATPLKRSPSPVPLDVTMPTPDRGREP
jgi:hypothetical protein